MPIQPTGDATSSVTDWLGLFLAFFSTAAAVIAAAATVLTFIVTVFAVLYARRQWLTARESRDDATRAEVARSQPYIGVYIDVPSDRPGQADLVVQNFGATAAYNITFEFFTPLQRSKAGLTDPEFAFFTVPNMSYLAPGQAWRTWWDYGPSRVKEPDLRKRFDGVAKYRGLDGEDLESPILLDFEPLEARIYNSTITTLRDVVKAVEKIPPAMKDSVRRLKGEPQQYRDPAAMFGVPAEDQPESPSTDDPTSRSRRVNPPENVASDPEPE